ncbi:hypothetical protein [Paenibacillus sp. PL2-23]|uniref:DUF7662 domain-containing protein n=1 Tax=Paenibacillus sp. PL2-23 TaxID=2100729 RepID=UPI0030FC78BA
MSKYDRLNDYLKNQIEIKLSYSELQQVIGYPLPPSAHTDRTWWGNTMNPTRTQAHAWLTAGWKVKGVDLGKSVIFIRNDVDSR